MPQTLPQAPADDLQAPEDGLRQVYHTLLDAVESAGKVQTAGQLPVVLVVDALSVRTALQCLCHLVTAVALRPKLQRRSCSHKLPINRSGCNS